MDIEDYRIFCLSHPGVTESFPFDERTLVFKVGGKMFSLLDIVTFDSLNLKCNPEKAVLLREEYQGVTPGFHMNKRHWNTVNCNGTITDKLLFEWTIDSYNLVWGSLSKQIRNAIL